MLNHLCLLSLGLSGLLPFRVGGESGDNSLLAQGGPGCGRLGSLPFCWRSEFVILTLDCACRGRSGAYDEASEAPCDPTRGLTNPDVGDSGLLGAGASLVEWGELFVNPCACCGVLP